MAVTLRLGSLFSGYGGLDLGVMAALPVRPVWHCEVDAAPARILAARFPDAVNLGDITAVDWGSVQGIDVLTGGFPCQDVSVAGKRAGIAAGTRSGLWSHFAVAIDNLRPRLVVIENVRGLLSAEASSNVEPCPHCMGDDSGGPVLRALGAVLGDLADLGYDATWGTFRASDVGACHRRERVFIVAHPADTTGTGQGQALRKNRLPRQSRGMDRTLPTEIVVSLADADIASRETRLNAGHHGPQLRRQSVEPAAPSADATRSETDWGPYADAIHRWEQTLGRPAPPPTEPGANNQPRLSPVFVEWMMGLDEGWVTGGDVGLSRAQQLKALGNGVVPQQATLAVRTLLAPAVVAA